MKKIAEKSTYKQTEVGVDPRAKTTGKWIKCISQ